MSEKEVLDFCRIKKIFDKGFGFLTSLYFTENVFLHFSKIKDAEKREAIAKIKRGVVSMFFTSKLVGGKRRADKLWLDIKDVPEYYLIDFIERLILKLNEGDINPFEIIDALRQIKEVDKLTEQNLRDIALSKKILKNPSIIEKLFSDKETEKLENCLKLIEKNKK